MHPSRQARVDDDPQVSSHLVSAAQDVVFTPDPVHLVDLRSQGDLDGMNHVRLTERFGRTAAAASISAAFVGDSIITALQDTDFRSS